MTHRESTVKPGDRVIIHLEDSAWDLCEATVRNVYRFKHNIAISAVVAPLDATKTLAATVPKAPDAGYHIVLTEGEFEIIKRRIYH